MGRWFLNLLINLKHTLVLVYKYQRSKIQTVNLEISNSNQTERLSSLTIKVSQIMPRHTNI
jgi:hypothetical protein